LDFNRISFKHGNKHTAKITPPTLFTELCVAALARLHYFTSKDYESHKDALNHPKVLQNLIRSVIGNASISERVSGGRLLLKLISKYDAGNKLASQRKYQIWKLASASRSVDPSDSGHLWLLKALLENLTHANRLKIIFIRGDDANGTTKKLIFQERLGLYRVCAGLLAHFGDKIKELAILHPTPGNLQLRGQVAELLALVGESLPLIYEILDEAEGQVPGVLPNALAGIIAAIPILHCVEYPRQKKVPRTLLESLCTIANSVQHNTILDTTLNVLRYLQLDVNKGDLLGQSVGLHCQENCRKEMMHTCSTGISAWSR
jgi:hypothetical protein